MRAAQGVPCEQVFYCPAASAAPSELQPQPQPLVWSPQALSSLIMGSSSFVPETGPAAPAVPVPAVTFGSGASTETETGTGTGTDIASAPVSFCGVAARMASYEPVGVSFVFGADEPQPSPSDAQCTDQLLASAPSSCSSLVSASISMSGAATAHLSLPSETATAASLVSAPATEPIPCAAHEASCAPTVPPVGSAHSQQLGSHQKTPQPFNSRSSRPERSQQQQQNSPGSRPQRLSAYRPPRHLLGAAIPQQQSTQPQTHLPSRNSNPGKRFSNDGGESYGPTSGSTRRGGFGGDRAPRQQLQKHQMPNPNASSMLSSNGAVNSNGFRQGAAVQPGSYLNSGSGVGSNAFEGERERKPPASATSASASAHSPAAAQSADEWPALARGRDSDRH